MKRILTTKSVACLAMLVLLCLSCHNRSNRTSITHKQNPLAATSLSKSDSTEQIVQTQDVVVENLAYAPSFIK
jgi:hypothetical protein